MSILAIRARISHSLPSISVISCPRTIAPSARLLASPALHLRSHTARNLSTSRPARQHKMSQDIIPVFTEKGVPPIGPYSQAVRAAGVVYVSGQIPADSKGKLIEGTVKEKTRKMCENARAVLEAAGSGLERAVKITVYFENLDDFKEMNEVYLEYFPHKPARSAIEAKRIPAGASMEMDIIALEK